MKKTKQKSNPARFCNSNTSQQGCVQGGWARNLTKFILIIALTSLSQLAFAYQIKIQNDTDMILMFDEVLNRQSIKIKAKPMVIFSGDQGIIKLGDGTSVKNVHLKMRYLVGQSGSPLSIVFGNNKGKCYVNSNNDAVSTSITYDKISNCGNSTVYIVVSGKVFDILDAIDQN